MKGVAAIKEVEEKRIFFRYGRILYICKFFRNEYEWTWKCTKSYMRVHKNLTYSQRMRYFKLRTGGAWRLWGFFFKKTLSASTYLSRMLYVRLRKYEKFRSERIHHKSVAAQMHSERIFFLKYIKCGKQWRFFDKFLEFSLTF